MIVAINHLIQIKDNDKKQELQISVAASLGDVSKALEKEFKKITKMLISFKLWWFRRIKTTD